MKLEVFFSVLAVSSTVVPSTTASSLTENNNNINNGWDTRISVQLSNDYHDFTVDRCPEQAMTNLQSEMYTWINDELLSIFAAPSSMSQLEYTNSNDVLANHVALAADFHCVKCGQKQWSSERSIHNVAYLLQWFTQLALEEWIDDNQEILDGCMQEDKIYVKLTLEKHGVEGDQIFEASKAVFSDKALHTISMLQK